MIAVTPRWFTWAWLHGDVDTAVETCASGSAGECSRELRSSPPAVTTSSSGHGLASGRWRGVVPGVYRFPVARPDLRARLMGGVLAARAQRCRVARSRRRAPRLPRLSRQVPRVVTVAHSGFARLPGVTVHQISDLTPEWCTTLGGLPVSTAATHVRRPRTRHPADPRPARRSTTPARRARPPSRRSRWRSMRCVGEAKPGVRLLGSVLDDLGPGVDPVGQRPRGAIA